VAKKSGNSIKRSASKNNIPAFKSGRLNFLRLFIFGALIAATGGIVLHKSFAASPPVTNFNLATYASGFSAPTDIANAGDGRLFIAQKNGVIKIINNDGTVRATPFLDIDSIVINGGNEEGLLGLVFHPNYVSNRYFYVYYTNLSGDNVVSRYQTSAGDPNVADSASGQIVLTIPHPTYNNHNGGDLNFGPTDGYLYIGTGDGGSSGDPNNNAQNINSILGKLLRLDINIDDFPSDSTKNYGIPSSNPFAGATSGADEIWAIGLRNPWRFDFDKLTKDMIIGDVGQNAREEVDFAAAGTGAGNNYGWRCYEGLASYNTAGCASQSSYVSPVVDYDHTLSRCSVTGGFVYRGPEYSTLQGVYLYTDYCSGHFYGIKQNGAAWDQVLAQQISGRNISSFGEDSSRRLYAADITNGTIYKVQADSLLSDTTAPTVSITAPSDGSTVSGASVVVSASASDNDSVAGVQFKVDGVDIGAEDTSNPYSVAWDSTTVTNGSHNLTAVARDPTGNITSSSIIAVTVSNSSKIGDLNSDNAVNIFDLSILLSNYGITKAQASIPACDINNDNLINIFDLSVMLSHYGT
jgi:glucose/arabinose dehydrogenase